MEYDKVHSQIITDSNKKLAVLRLLSNFFNHPDLIAILIRTGVIHNLFENNRDLDIHKLDLFHTQYTSSVIELLRKIKRCKEQQYKLTLDEIQLNEEFLSKVISSSGDQVFTNRWRGHSKNMSAKIRQLYQMFAFDLTTLFSWEDVIEFSDAFKSEYYREITPKQYNELKNLSRK